MNLSENLILSLVVITYYYILMNLNSSLNWFVSLLDRLIWDECKLVASFNFVYIENTRTGVWLGKRDSLVLNTF